MVSNSHDYLPYTDIWKNLSIRMLIKTSTAFSLSDKEDSSVKGGRGSTVWLAISTFVNMWVHDENILTGVSIIHEQ